MRGRVSGVDRKTGRESAMTIEAADEESARRRANRQGLLVEDVMAIDPNDSVYGDKPPVMMLATCRVAPVDMLARAAAEHVVDYRRSIHSAHPPVHLIEQTAKKWKAHTLLGGLVMFVGGVGAVLLTNDPRTKELAAVAGFVFVFGLAWYLWARMGAWWNHG
jgi:hypothetical protein